MTVQHPRTLAASTLTATSLLLAACSGSANTAAKPAHSASPNTTSTAPAGPSTGPAPASSTAETPGSGTVAVTGSCGLVTASEVGTATGKAMGQGADAGTICSYSATADPSTVVYVQLFTDAQSMGAAKATETGSEHLSGLGDDAFWTAAGTVFVQKGSRGFTISVPSLALASPSAPKEIVILATDALTRL